MSIESVQSSSDATCNATPRHGSEARKMTSTLPQTYPMGDVLLGEEITMMGCDVDAWNVQQQQQLSTPNSRPLQLYQPPPTSGYFTTTTSAPASLTRHVSLPVPIMRPHVAPHYGVVVSPAHAMQQIPPTLARHHSHGYISVMHHHQPPQTVYQPMTRPVVHVTPMQQMLELSLSNQQHHASPANGMHIAATTPVMKHETYPASSAAMNVEPIAFTSINSNETKMGLDESFDLDPLAYAVFGPSGSATTVGKPATGMPQDIQQLESAFESLDRLLPEMDQDLFRNGDMSTNVGATSLITPRVVGGRGSLPILISPTLKSSPSASMMLGVTPRSAKHMATCKISGCDRRVRSKGFCKTHGGGRKCSIEGCKKSSQNGDFCIGHGGGKKCKEEGCAKAAQSHGLCKAHGGGARCKFPDCNKSSQGGGLCRAHGGGKRCQAAGCPKGAQRGNFCATHGGFRNCKIEGCVRTDRGGGFCEVHRRGRLCKIDGCKKLSRNQGMCTMHIREDKQENASTSAATSSGDEDECTQHQALTLNSTAEATVVAPLTA